MLHRPLLPVLALSLAAALGLAACTTTGAASPTSGSSTTGATSDSSTPTAMPTPARVDVAPADRAKNVLPTTKVVVTARTGTLQTVTVRTSKGKEVPGAIAGSTWTSSGRLAPSESYTVETVAAGSDGAAATSRTSFSTLTPKVTATYHLLYTGTTVGVGMPATIQFDSSVATAAMRAEVEKNITVTSVPKVEGHFGWIGDRALYWRPKAYWPAGTKVSIKADLSGVQTGESKWVANNATGTMAIGSSMISTVDLKTHHMTVRRNGKVIRVVAISGGSDRRPQFISRSGTKVIIEKAQHVVMDSATVGIPKTSPEYYRNDVYWNLRVTWTGEYLHSAPWSVGAQGSANVSHGCINIAPGNAQWMYNQSKVGDVVVTTGSNRQMAPGEGIGVWQFSWANWVKESAVR